MSEHRVVAEVKDYKLEVDLGELWEALPQEMKEEIVLDNSFSTPLWEALYNDVVHGFSTPNFNPYIFQFRQALLKDHLPELFANFIAVMVKETEWERRRTAKQENISDMYWAYIQENGVDHQHFRTFQYEWMSKHPDSEYPRMPNNATVLELFSELLERMLDDAGK